ncbi:MAG: hypothetical protein AB8H86_31970 [Polyangiales bacterium]
MPEPLPEHLVLDEGIVYSRELTVRDAAVPERFAASPLVEGAEGLTWHGLVTGLETNRSGMWERFEDALTMADRRQRARLSTALSACYSGLFGFRSAGSGRDAFDAWVATLSIKPDRERALIDVPKSGDIAGCVRLPFSPGTGHFPVGHDLLLYLLAEVESLLDGAEFADVARFDADKRTREELSPYTLQAWTHGRVFEAPAHARGDTYDVPGVVGFFNAVLRDMGGEGRFRLVDGGAAYGAAASLRALGRKD